jgi:hypothetical protein
VTVNNFKIYIMKKFIFGLIAFLTISISCVGQSKTKSEIIGEPKIIINNNSMISEEFEASARFPFNFTITVAADYVNVVSTDCWTVNVRVYFNTEQGSILMANQNVNVGSGCPQGRISNDSSVKCPTKEYKGDLVIENKDSYEYCLIELLEDENIYKVYERIKIEYIKRNLK